MLKHRLRKLRQKVKQSGWVPTHLQTPEPLFSNRYPSKNLSVSCFSAHRQPDCRFLTLLPVEIRLRIFEYVFADPPLTYEQDCQDENQTALEGIKFPVNCLWRIPGRLSAKPPLRYSYNYASHRLNCLLTCKQTYTETIDLFYALPTFLISDLHVFFDFSRALIPHRLASIRKLHLQFLLRWPEIIIWWEKPTGTPDNKHLWLKLWAVVSQHLTGLQALRLYIRQFTWGSAKPNAATEARVLQPVRQVRGLREFILWYRHAKVRHPFGVDYEDIYTYDVTGEECGDQEAKEAREELAQIVKLARGKSCDEASGPDVG